MITYIVIYPYYIVDWINTCAYYLLKKSLFYTAQRGSPETHPEYSGYENPPSEYANGVNKYITQLFLFVVNMNL